MFQDIDPHALAYDPARADPREQDRVLFLRDGRVLLNDEGGALALPGYGEVHGRLEGGGQGLIHLFTVDGVGYHYSPEAPDEAGGFAYRNIRVARALTPATGAFAAATGFHFALWYANNRFCGLCAAPMEPRPGERALHCPACGLVKYPRISPAVIVGVRDGDKLLLSKYTGREYKNYALIAGFVDPGETLEAAAAREVMEEVGLRIVNPRYYKSQPWAFSQSILMGFFADLDGDPAITIDPDELQEAGWYHRSEIPADDVRFSLTWDMMQAFREGEV